MKSTFVLTPTRGNRLTRIGAAALLLTLSSVASAQNAPDKAEPKTKGALQQHQQNLFVKLDQDKDGRISAEEAEEAEDNTTLVSEFTELDYNNDGHLSAEEISDWEGMREFRNGR